MMSVQTNGVIAEIKTALVNMANVMPGYMRRDTQMKMVNEIRQILESSPVKVAVCEAGTGVGKTMAYLLATVPVALAQNKKVVISTATVALQEQIVQKDLPLFEAIYPKPVRSLMLKGKSRFVCRQKLEMATGIKQGGFDFEDAMFTAKPSATEMSILDAMKLAMASGEWQGDLDEWKGEKLNYELLSAIVTDSHSCKPNFVGHKKCAYHFQRVDMDSADIVVVNHALVAADLEMGGGVLLPDIADAIYVFDEAHHLPRVVRDASAKMFQLLAFDSVLKSLELLSRQGLSVLPNGKKHKSDLLKATHYAQLVSANLKAWCNANTASFYRSGRDYHRFEFGILPSSLARAVEEFVKAVKSVRRVLKAIDGSENEADDHAAQQVDKVLSQVGFFISRMDDAADCFRLLLADRAGHMPVAKWLEFEKERNHFRFGASEIAVGHLLKEQLWQGQHSGVVLTSATLQSFGTFNKYAFEVGLNYDQSAFFKCYESPYDYAKQGRLAIAPDVPFEPSDPNFDIWLMHHLIGYLKGKRSSLVLFTSRAQMYRVRSHIESAMTKAKTLLQCQGDNSRSQIIENHSRAIQSGLNSVIFGLNSYAEGLDLKGELLENLIIVKLPFEVPNSPVSASLMEYESRMGNNPFYTVTLPNAERALVQAVGRLIRTEGDKGQCTVLDNRLVTKRYGQLLIGSLPPFSIIGNK